MENCAICLQPYTEEGLHSSVELSCGHKLGRSCAMAWIRIQSTCPTCRQPVEPTGLVPDRPRAERIHATREIVRDAYPVIRSTIAGLEKVEKKIRKIRSATRRVRFQISRQERSVDDLVDARDLIIAIFDRIPCIGGILADVGKRARLAVGRVFIATSTDDELQDDDIQSEYYLTGSWFVELLGKLEETAERLTRAIVRLEDAGNDLEMAEDAVQNED